MTRSRRSTALTVVVAAVAAVVALRARRRLADRAAEAELWAAATDPVAPPASAG